MGMVRRWALALGPVLLLMLAGASAALAHIVVEAPWHSLAYAYRSAIFLINLDPIDWALVERKFTTDDDGRNPGLPPADRLQQLDQETGGAYWPAIETALAARRPDALFAASTRALSAAIRHRLSLAAANLSLPGVANKELTEAEQIHRAFSDIIRQTDPDGYRELGLAWLELSSSVGHGGVMTVGARSANDDAFETARAAINAYLVANYEPDQFALREHYQPIPEQRFLVEPHLQVAPWLPPGSDLNDRDPLPRLVLNFETQGIDERKLFMVAFGDMLFDSPEIFGEPARSLGMACSTCHNRGDTNTRLFIPGLGHQPGAIDVDGSYFNSKFNDQRPDPIDIPSLRGLRFTAPYGRDGRFASLHDFTRNVIVNEFGGDEPSPLMLDALVAYQLEFDFLPAPFLDADGRLPPTAPEAARRGEALFHRPFEQMGGRACASCHLPDSHFTDNQVHDIGSAGMGSGSGFSGALDTPSLLGSRYTAPYFHDGALPTLGHVVAWFDDRFGLGLAAPERDDLTAYLEAIGTATEPFQAYDDELTPFRLMYDELMTFLSTLDTLIPEQDRAHADLLLRTVAADLEADAAAMTNRAAQAKVEGLVERLWQLRDVIARERWDEAALQWATVVDLARQYDPEVR
jgi:cytochrome c peroxidase